METINIEETAGYKLAITFKPFINPKCSSHMEIVCDMAKAINSLISKTVDRKGEIFNQGYKEGIKARPKP